MGLVASLSKLERKFAWSFLGFVLAVIFGALSLYIEFWRDVSARLEFNILSNTPVLSVQEQVPQLEVLYNGYDIAKGGQTLSVLLMRVVNSGSANLLTGDYDSKVPIGVDVSGGTLIRADVAGASNDYIEQVAGARPSQGTVTFEPVILEPGEWFLVKLLVLHDLRSQPGITARGKIAGMKGIPVTSSTATSKNANFWYRAFSGSAWTQIVRLLGYVVGFVGLLFLLIAPPAFIIDKVSLQRRKRLVSRFKKETKAHYGDADQTIFDGFVNGGAPYVEWLSKQLSDPEQLHEDVKKHLERKDDFHAHGPGPFIVSDVDVEGDTQWVRMIPFFDLGALIKRGLVVQSDGRWVVAPEHQAVAKAFTEYVQRHPIQIDGTSR